MPGRSCLAAVTPHSSSDPSTTPPLPAFRTLKGAATKARPFSLQMKGTGPGVEGHIASLRPGQDLNPGLQLRPPHCLSPTQSGRKRGLRSQAQALSGSTALFSAFRDELILRSVSGPRCNLPYEAYHISGAASAWL